MDSSNFHHVEYKRPSPSSSSVEELKAEKKLIIRYKYKECLKNHAASIGGNATDGCGEFMPSAKEEGTPEAFKCSACNCHRNFHRKETQYYYSNSDQYCLSTPFLPNNLDHFSPNKSGSNLCDQSDYHGNYNKDMEEDEDDHWFNFKEVEKPCDEKMMKKRFRTKFSAEQKEKMVRFAEKAGWRMQKLEESLVQQFCQEIGINRRVLKVWIHNNKNTYAKRKTSLSIS